MLSRRGPFLILLSLVLAVAAAYFGYRWATQQEANQQATPGTVPVAVARSDIPFGTTVEASHVAIIQMLEGTPPDGTFPTVAAVEGKVARSSIMKGEILLEGRFTAEGEGSTLCHRHRARHAGGQRARQRRRRRRRFPAAGKSR